MKKKVSAALAVAALMTLSGCADFMPEPQETERTTPTFEPLPDDASLEDRMNAVHERYEAYKHFYEVDDGSAQSDKQTEENDVDDYDIDDSDDGIDLDAEDVLMPSDNMPQSAGGNSIRLYDVDHATAFYDGYATVEPDRWSEGIYDGWYAIDTAGNILFSLKSVGNYSYNYFETHRGVFIDDNSHKMIDKNGNIMLSPEKDGYTGFIECEHTPSTSYYSDRINPDGYVIAYRIDESYDGTVYSLGVLDTAGNWVRPLTSKLDLFDENVVIIPQNSMDYMMRRYRYVGENLIMFSNGILYDYMEDIVYPTTVRYDDVYFAKNGYLYFSKSGCAKMELKTGEVTPATAGGHNYLFANDEVIITYDQYGEGCPCYEIYDYDGNLLSSVSDKVIEGQSRRHGIDYKDGMFLTFLKGKSGGTYISLMDLNGDFMFEPIKAEMAESAYITDNGIVYNDSERFYIMDFEGNVRFSRECMEIMHYDSGMDLFSCDQGGYKYYYVDSKGNTL